MSNAGKKEGGIGGGSLQIPTSVLGNSHLRAGDIPVPVDVTAVQGEINQRAVDEKTARERISALYQWLNAREGAPQAERDQFAEEIRRYRGVLEGLLRHTDVTIRRVAGEEMLKHSFGKNHTSFEQIGETIADLEKQGHIIKVVAAEPAEGEVELRLLWGVPYRVKTDYCFGEQELQRIQDAFNGLVGRVRAHIVKEWEYVLKGMQHRSQISLEQLVNGQPGLCYCEVPPDPTFKFPDGKPHPLEGGHLLLSSNGEKINVQQYCGDSVSGKGFSFCYGMQKLEQLTPRPFLLFWTLKYWSPFPRSKDGERKSSRFFEENPANAKAVTLMHATIRRGVILAHGKGELKAGDIRYLQPRQQPKPAEPSKAVEPGKDATKSDNAATSDAKPGQQPEASATPAQDGLVVKKGKKPSKQ